MLFKLKDTKLPDNEPHIKLVPIIKLIGRLTVSFVKRLTLDFFELFWMPTIRMVIRLKLNAVEKIIFLKKIDI